MLKSDAAGVLLTASTILMYLKLAITESNVYSDISISSTGGRWALIFLGGHTQKVFFEHPR